MKKIVSKKNFLKVGNVSKAMTDIINLLVKTDYNNENSSAVLDNIRNILIESNLLTEYYELNEFDKNFIRSLSNGGFWYIITQIEKDKVSVYVSKRYCPDKEAYSFDATKDLDITSILSKESIDYFLYIKPDCAVNYFSCNLIVDVIA